MTTIVRGAVGPSVRLPSPLPSLPSRLASVFPARPPALPPRTPRSAVPVCHRVPCSIAQCGTRKVPPHAPQWRDRAEGEQRGEEAPLGIAELLGGLPLSAGAIARGCQGPPGGAHSPVAFLFVCCVHVCIYARAPLISGVNSSRARQDKTRHTHSFSYLRHSAA